MSQRPIKPDDYRSLKYFHQERSLSRYCAWEDIQEDLQRKHPEVIKAVSDLLAAKRTLDLVIDNLPSGEEEL
jgi:hypothetical protein